ncbi:putative D-amino-acid oxidase [Colletotrichum asianum]|uniref:FAD dependent oxidoreductase n=1 Tax=Colletotrichum asianum TaxID=702518 RepID=A0A8H3WTD3_9PEZI|nr:FAD dependent oxidoreductase [Colletotrichum asianum]
MAPHESIVIVGAGIIGLDVALVLAEKGFGQCTTVVAEYLPGDTAHTYTSPWAGCNFSAISSADPAALKWDKAGYLHLQNLAATDSRNSFVRKTPSVELWDDNVPHEKIEAMSEYLQDFRTLSNDELPQGVKFAASFTTLTVNAPKHLLYLYRRLKDEYGVQFIRRTLSNIREAFVTESTEVIFNCTGIGARALPGVEDSRCYPTRGQVLLAKAPDVNTNIMRHGKDYETYVIPRPYSGGHVILGGYMQKDNGDGATYSHESDSILSRTMELSSEVKGSDPEVIAAFAGLRPSRKGGARVEREDMVIAGLNRAVIHNYGAGGTGFQAGYGMALDAVHAAEPFLFGLKHRDRARI